MAFNPEVHHRRSIRLRDYDYSRAGAYFVTICAFQRESLFGEVVGGEMRLNDAGWLARQCWRDIPDHFPHVELDEYVIMPNHIHGIVVITDTDGAKNVGVKAVGAKNVGMEAVGAKNVGAKAVGAKNVGVKAVRAKNFSPQHQGCGGTSKTIGSIVRGFKIGVTKWMRNNTPIYDVWQRNYYERVIRNERELAMIRQYIADNPAKWAEDENHPGRG